MSSEIYLIGHKSVRMYHMLNIGFMKLSFQLYMYGFVYTGFGSEIYFVWRVEIKKA